MIASSVALVALSGCKAGPKRYTSNVELMQVKAFGQQAAAGSPSFMDLELKFVDCPGNARRVIRGDKAFSACGKKLKAGDKVPAEVEVAYSAERGTYRDTIVKLADCEVKLDPKDEANYQMVENCSDLKASGMVVGVHCDRGRTKELVEACPWFRRD
jgi:hypothetical protein